jgi:hypothetical protein
MRSVIAKIIRAIEEPVVGRHALGVGPVVKEPRELLV